MITAPWRYRSSFAEYSSDIIPISWFGKENKTYPYEFGFFPYSRTAPAELGTHASFVEVFFDAVKHHGLEGTIGLRRLSGHESIGTLECTEGNVNIIFPGTEVGSFPSTARHQKSFPRDVETDVIDICSMILRTE